MGDQGLLDGSPDDWHTYRGHHYRHRGAESGRDRLRGGFGGRNIDHQLPAQVQSVTAEVTPARDGVGAQRGNTTCGTRSWSSVVASGGRGVGRGAAFGRGAAQPFGDYRSGLFPTNEGEQVRGRGNRGVSVGCARARGGGIHRGGRGESRAGAAEKQCGGKYDTPITATVIRQFSTLDPQTVAKKIHNQLRDFQRTIEDAKFVSKPQIMDDIVQILLKLTTLANEIECEEQRLASIIIAEILSERSQKFNIQLKRTVQIMCTVPRADIFCKLFQLMLTRFESLAWDYLPIDEFYESVKRLTKAGTTNSALLKRAENLCEIRDQIRDKKANPTVALAGEWDDSGYQSLPILPEWKEIKEDKGTPPEVRPNKVDTPYKDWMEYYDIQFRLIREDFIAPLRRGVAAFLQGDKGKKNRDVKTYGAAKIVSQVTTKEKGICFNVKFDVSGFRKKNFNWSQSKRLIFGSLLCFIPTDRKSESNVIFAIVAGSDFDKLREGKIMVQCEGDILEAMNHCGKETEFEIVESSAYFEATSPILRSIQTANTETMPFMKQLIQGDCEVILPPIYLRANEEHPPLYNLKCLYGTKRRLKELIVNVLDKASWEAASNTELDSSQLNAIQTALTQEIAVIQGPPGTGKTYIGLKIVEALLENRHIWDPNELCPILVMCYTNHALDQFLEGIIDTECCGREPNVIRVGGRCKNEKVDAHNLKKIRNHQRQFNSEIASILRDLEFCNPERALNKLNSHYKRSSLLPLDQIRTVADPDHYYQLTQVVKCKEQVGNEAEVWVNLWTDTPSGSKAGIKKNPALIEQRDTKGTNVYNLFDKLKSEFVDVDCEAILAQNERMDDSDLEGYKRATLSINESEPPVVSHYQEEFSDDESDDEHLKQKPQRYRKGDADKVIGKKIRTTCMEDDEVREVDDITNLSNKDRWRLYNYWEQERLKYLESENRKLVKEYTEKCKRLEKLRQLEDGHTLEAADVVGMTTSGAAKYQHILHHIKPKIVIVEEAAEVLEAHIVSALSAGTQHLILIGDHKQLRPKPNEYVLETKYNLSISLFERLVMKQMSQATLEIQHRMRPEIAQLVCPHVYEKLLNHESVEKYPDIQGIEKNLFFVCHSEPESEHPGLLSYQNQFEADYIVGLCAHLLTLGYSQRQITILTPYVGQLLLLRDKMPKKEFEGVRIAAIDNFQGEENGIILFSMVRSTNPNSSRTTIGFVKEDNRVCVSLSRAKQGFYAIGNFELIRHQSQLWESIISDVESRECYGNALPLYCCNHPETKYSAMKYSDFKTNAPNGGCRIMCDIRLRCGHSCTKICHVFDKEHTKFLCMKACRETCPFNHTCKSLCHQKCPPCNENVERIMPRCGHTQKMKCSEDPREISCREIVVKTMPFCGHEQEMPCSFNPAVAFCQAPCSKSCELGHPCQRKCHEDCQDCLVEVEKVIPGCQHKQMVPCHLPPNEFHCRAPCPKRHADCLHLCERMCFEPCRECRVIVQKTLPKCGHSQRVMCFKDPDPALCVEECKKICPNKLHVLRKRCNERWPQCKEKVTKTIPKCGHKVVAECCQDPSKILCPNPCLRLCDYKGHQCPKQCHEECAPCLAEVKVSLECGHTHTMPCDKASTNTFVCPTQCSKPTCEKGHKCPKQCHHPSSCGPCSEIVTVTLPQCSHEQRVKCYMSLNIKKHKIICDHPCEKKLKCGHECLKKCGVQCQKMCYKKVFSGLPCGHHKLIECCSDRAAVKCDKEISLELTCGHMIKTKCWKQRDKASLTKMCKEKCSKVLKCGHPCKEICNKPCTRSCKKYVSKTLPCGHEIKMKCFEQDTSKYSCKERCLKKLQCGHPCTNRCGEPCSTCHQKSLRRYPCGHSSKILCTANVEDYPSCKKMCSVILHCGHRCSGKCGDCSLFQMHPICMFQIRLDRYCGHSAIMSCAGLSDSCDHKTHKVPCTHSEDYSNCHKPCTWECKHFRCAKECREECERPPCDRPCEKWLPCGCKCPGLCGEWCLSVCHNCDPVNFTKKFHPKPKQGKLPKHQPFFELNCGHIFTVSYLDDYMKSSDKVVRPKQCPKCHQNIDVGNRYGNYVRRVIKDVENIKVLVKELQSVSEHERIDLKYTCRSLTNRSPYLSCDGLKMIQDKVKKNFPVTAEERCFVQCIDSYSTLCGHPSYSTRKKYWSAPSSEGVILKNLMDSAEKCITPKHEFDRLPPKPPSQIHLSWQLLEDFMSRLYCWALSVQCSIAKSDSYDAESSVATVEHYIKSLDPLKHRVSEAKYEELFCQLTSAVPDVAHIHVRTPDMPTVVKGTWMKCQAGHYYCLPPVCGAGATRTDDCCPACK